MDTPIIRYCAVSGIEHGHKESITDLLWVPDHMEVGDSKKSHISSFKSMKEMKIS